MPEVISSRAAGAARVRQEGPIDLLTAAGLFPRGDRWRPMTARTLLRFIVSGKAGVRLDAVRVKGKWKTSIAAMSRFVAETAAKG